MMYEILAFALGFVSALVCLQVYLLHIAAQRDARERELQEIIERQSEYLLNNVNDID